MELTALTLTEAAILIEQRKISPLELTRAHLERIERVNPMLNCFITITPEAALTSAKEAEEAILHGDYRGMLHGIPLALKDIFETRGVRTTAGSKFLANYLPDADSTVVEKLRAAGAVFLGKLNMHEWAMRTSNNNPHYGACKNPWNLNRIPGGSSGGSGAALAAELCMGSLGTDTGGSVRVPAALCSVVGLKPSYGRVSTRGVIPLSWNLDHVGPMARCVRDVAVLLQAIAGYDASDPYSINVPADDYLAYLEAGIQGWHVALAFTRFFPEEQTGYAYEQATNWHLRRPAL